MRVILAVLAGVAAGVVVFASIARGTDANFATLYTQKIMMTYSPKDAARMLAP